MPTQIHNPRATSRDRYYARQSAQRNAQQMRLRETITAPWKGWVPDLPPHLAGWSGYRDGRGLIPLVYEGRGLFLRHDDGYERIDETQQPGGSGVDLWTALPITSLFQYYNDANPPVRRRCAIISSLTAGPVAAIMVYLDGAGLWQLVAANAAIGAAGGSGIPTNAHADRETLWDHAFFPFGCPGRMDAAVAPAGNAFIDAPCVVLAGADEIGPTWPVLVTPDETGSADPPLYDELQRDATTLPGPAFMATSVESFDGRMHYLATIEGGTVGNRGNAFPQRHRWSAVGDAWPDEGLVGSGYLDLVEFQERGLRIESLGNKLVLYFGDGVAFQVPTGFYADAYRPQIISRSRGLIGTKALVPISPQLHFGIFNDGWWFLDSSGRWSEAGTLVLEETKGKSHELTKWKQTFYDDLDYDNKHRTTVEYDRFRRLIRIAYTSNNSEDNTQILNYHWPTDTCWKDQYPSGVSVWGLYDRQTALGTDWDNIAGTWDTIVGTWDSYGPQYIDEAIVHGHTTGIINGRDPDLTTYDDVAPYYYYTTHQFNRNSDPLKMSTFSRLGVEYMNIGGSDMLLVVASDEFGSNQTDVIAMSENGINTIQNSSGHFRLNGGDLGFTVSGLGPVMIRSIVAELLVQSGDDREGQP